MKRDFISKISIVLSYDISVKSLYKMCEMETGVGIRGVEGMNKFYYINDTLVGNQRWREG